MNMFFPADPLYSPNPLNPRSKLLRATKIEIGLLLNFGKRPEFKRKYFSNPNKQPKGEQQSGKLLESLFTNEPF